MNRTAVLGLLALASLSAQADEGALAPRVGLAAAFGQFQGDDVPSSALGNKYIDDNAVGFKAYAQYPLNDWFAVEGAYHYTSNFKDKQKSPELPAGNLKLSFDGWSAQGLVYIPTTIEDFQAYVKAGYYDFSDELVLNGSTISNSSERGLVAGGGAILKIADQLGVRLDFDWFDADAGDLSSVNLGIEYSFGGEKPVAAAPVAPVAMAAAPVVAAAPPPPADGDGDGVADTADQCPDTPRGERVGAYGCSCDVTRQVEFAFDSADLTDAGRATLDEVAETLGRLKFVEGSVTGYTDNVGDPAYNQKLSERRAQTVASYLQEKGVATGRLSAVGMGDADPVADNATSDGRAQNRRVVLRRTDCEAPK